MERFCKLSIVYPNFCLIYPYIATAIQQRLPFLGSCAPDHHWFPIIKVYERANKPIIGIPKNSLVDFDGLIDAKCVRPIRPDMDDISGLDRVVLKGLISTQNNGQAS